MKLQQPLPKTALARAESPLLAVSGLNWRVTDESTDSQKLAFLLPHRDFRQPYCFGANFLRL